jgi:hypothetical protein
MWISNFKSYIKKTRDLLLLLQIKCFLIENNSLLMLYANRNLWMKNYKVAKIRL